MKRKSIGSLHGHLAAIADHVCKTARDCMVMVWVSDCAEVYADPDAAADRISQHNIVGIYSMGMQSSDIIDDLLEARRERLRAGMLD